MPNRLRKLFEKLQERYTEFEDEEELNIPFQRDIFIADEGLHLLQNIANDFIDHRTLLNLFANYIVDREQGEDQPRPGYHRGYEINIIRKKLPLNEDFVQNRNSQVRDYNISIRNSIPQSIFKLFSENVRNNFPPKVHNMYIFFFLIDNQHEELG